MIPREGIMVPGMCPPWPIRPKGVSCPRVDETRFSMTGLEKTVPGTVSIGETEAVVSAENGMSKAMPILDVPDCESIYPYIEIHGNVNIYIDNTQSYEFFPQDAGTPEFTPVPNFVEAA